MVGGGRLFHKNVANNLMITLFLWLSFEIIEAFLICEFCLRDVFQIILIFEII